MATIEENLNTIKESTQAMKNVIEANGGDASGDITTWANSIQTVLDNGGDGIVQTSLKYYDDGTGEVVPIKHPDLSTQPSILPYKFAGNYVYEQMFYEKIVGSISSQYSLGNIGTTNPLILDGHISWVNTDGTVSTDVNSYLSISKDGELTINIDNSSVKGTDMYARVVWTQLPSTSNPYY